MNNKIIEFLLLQNQLIQAKKISSFYRGDNLDNLYTRFGITNNGSSEKQKELLQRIFLIGDKSKYFYEEKLFGLEITTRNIELTDESEIVLDKIFQKFKSATKSNKEYIEDYFNRNLALKNYFKNNDNNKNFITSIQQSPNPLSFRNYYLKILHQLFFIKYRTNSHFVSTSSDKLVTEKFAGKNGVIIHCWQPNYFLFKKDFQNKNLPHQESLAFKEQKEFSFLAGILPHYISAIEFIEDKTIHFNPNILTNDIKLNVFFDGLEIDQTNFNDVILKTEFRKYFTRNGLSLKEYDK